MSFTEYETAKEAAERLGISSRAVQKRAAEGRIPGAVKHGRSWLIPKTCADVENSGADRPETGAERANSDPDSRKSGADRVIRRDGAHRHKTDTGKNRLQAHRGAMPIMSGTYQPGLLRDFIDGLEDPDDRSIALGEFYFYSGRSTDAANVIARYQDSADPELCFSANTVAVFANLSGGRPELIWLAFRNLQRLTGSVLGGDSPPELRALVIFFATMASVLFHIPIPEIPPLDEYLHCLPEGLKVYACYILAHKAYLEKNYQIALTIADLGIALGSKNYPIGYIYCQIMAAIALVNLKLTKEALARLEKAWEVAEPDGLIQPFGEHHGLLHGLIEVFFKDKAPELHKRIDDITYAFSAGWRIIHNGTVRRSVPDNLTTLEFTIAMLYSRGWTAPEISKQLRISTRTVYNRITMIFNKLGISEKKELAKYMLY